MYVKKPTRFMANSERIRQDVNLKRQEHHRRMELTGGKRTKRSEVYPDRLCKAMLKGLAIQVSDDERQGCSCNAGEVVHCQGNEHSVDINEVRYHEMSNRADVPLKVFTWEGHDVQRYLTTKRTVQIGS